MILSSTTARRTLCSALATLALATLAPAGQAGDTLFFYGLNDRGTLSVGGTVLDNYKSKYSPTDGTFTEQQWVDLVVNGADRWALRLDGRIEMNGAPLRTLPFDIESQLTSWIAIAASTELYALRFDGLLAQDDATDFTYPPSTFLFTSLIAPSIDIPGDGPNVYVLRSDGAVFGGELPTAGIMFQGGAGLTGALDGQFVDTTWVAMAIDPTTDLVHGLRADGKIQEFSPSEFVITPSTDPAPLADQIADLPFPTDALQITPADAYIDIAFDENGMWYVLRRDGAVFRSDDIVTPLVDLPGNGLTEDGSFVDVDARGSSFFVLRADGQVFQDDAGTVLVDLTKKRYRKLAVSDTPPDLTNFKNRKPSAAVYKSVLLQDEPLELPIIITDLDKASEDLIVEVDLTGLPGALWDPMTRVVSWPGGFIGKYRVLVTADDGLLKKPVRFKYSVKVSPPDTNLSKNRPPTPSKIKRVQGLVGFESVVPLFATDKDGDDITWSVDETKGIFALGATFDPDTATITWTPEFEHLGKQLATVFVSDGTKTKKLKVKFLVVNPLIF